MPPEVLRWSELGKDGDSRLGTASSGQLGHTILPTPAPTAIVA